MLFNFTQSHLSVLGIIPGVAGGLSRNLLPVPKSLSIIVTFPSSSFGVWSLMLRSLIYFWIDFRAGGEMWLLFRSFICGSPASQHPLLKGPSFSLIYDFNRQRNWSLEIRTVTYIYSRAKLWHVSVDECYELTSSERTVKSKMQERMNKRKLSGLHMSRCA